MIYFLYKNKRFLTYVYSDRLTYCCFNLFTCLIFFPNQDREFELWSDVTLPSSDDEEQEKAAVDARRVLGLLEEGGRVLGEIDGRQRQ